MAEKAVQNPNGPLKPQIPKAWIKPTATRTITHRMVWMLVVIATLLVLALTFVIFKIVLPEAYVESGPPKLGAEFRDMQDNLAISPPLGWKLEDRVPGSSIIFRPKQMDGKFLPLIITMLEPGYGKLEKYVAEHKSRLMHDDKSIQWLSESDDAIAGCPVKRLEYLCDYQENDKAPVVKLKNLQYIIDDHTQFRFYRVTCFSRVESYEKFLPIFEKSAHSFRRLPIPEVKVPRYLPQ